MIGSENQCLKTVTSAFVKADVQVNLNFLQQRLQDLEHALLEAVECDPHWRQQAELLESVPGVGHITTVTLLAELSELGTPLSAKEIAALAGVAPSHENYEGSPGRTAGRRETGGCGLK